MAELTTLEEKLAEVLGLAQAAQGATEKVEGLVEDDEIAAKLQQMREEAEETERRCTEVADQRDGKKTAILEKAQETKGEADGDDVDLPRRRRRRARRLRVPDDGRGRRGRPLGGARKLNEKAGEEEIAELVEWALPIQERHFSDVKEGSLKLAGEEDPYA